MFALFVMIVVIIGILATVGYTIISYQNTLENTSLVQRNASRMEVVSVLMRAGARPVVAGGVVRAPAGTIIDQSGDPADGRTVAPSFVVGDNKTPWGAYYGYCPSALPAGSVMETSTGTVDVNGVAVDVRRLAGRDYIISSDGLPTMDVVSGSPPPGILGFIVAPTPNRFAIPECDEIIFRDGAFLIGVDGGQTTTGGTVIPILADTSSLALPAQIEPTINVAPTTQNEGTGLDADNAMSFEDAIAYWIGSRPGRLTMRLANGSYELDDSLSFALQNDLGGRFLRIVDSTPDDPAGAVIGSDHAVWLVMGPEVSIEGIGLGDGVGIRALPGSRVTIAASDVGRIRVDGGDVILRSDSSVSMGSAWGVVSPIEMSGGDLVIAQAPSGDTLAIASTVTSEPAIKAFGGRISILADISAPAFSLPWSFSGAADLQVGATGYSSAYPNFTHSGGTQAITATAAATAGAMSGGGVATATCPETHPNVISGSCNSSDGVLSSSRSVAGGWQCKWTALATVPAVALPSNATATAVCSAAPAR